MAGKLGAKHSITGQDKFFKYKKAKEWFVDKSHLPVEQLEALDHFFKVIQNWKPWQIDLLTIMVKQGFTDLADRFERIQGSRLRSLEYFIELWGEEEGKKKHSDLVKQASSNFITTDFYWEKKGLPKDQEAINQHNAKGLKKCNDMMRGSSEYTIRSVKYWERKGHTPDQAREIVRKIQTSNGLEWYKEQYGEVGQELFERRIADWKTNIKETMIEQGMWRSDEDLSEIEAYYRDVSRHTEQNYRKHFSLINPGNLPRDGKSFELDHRYSKMAGFRDSIPAEVIGHWINLEMLPASENNSKWISCSINKKQLLEDYLNSGDVDALGRNSKSDR